MLAALLRGTPEIGAREQAFPFVTVDPQGFPHTALLSRMEVAVGPGNADLRAAVRSTRTRANLDRDGRAALIAVEGRTAHYVKLRVVRAQVVHDLLACVLTVVEHKPDSMGVALSPITYEVTARSPRRSAGTPPPRPSGCCAERRRSGRGARRRLDQPEAGVMGGRGSPTMTLGVRRQLR